MKTCILLLALALVGCAPRTVPSLYLGMHEDQAELNLAHAHPPYWFTSVRLDLKDKSFVEWFSRTSGDRTCDYVRVRVKNRVVTDVQYFTF